jgi:hypothetical protein
MVTMRPGAGPKVGEMAVSVPLHASNLKCEIREVLNSYSEHGEGQKHELPYATFEAIANSVLSLVDKLLDQPTTQSLEDAIGRVEKTSQMILDKLERNVQLGPIVADTKNDDMKLQLDSTAVINDVDSNAISKAGKVVQIKAQPGQISGELIHQLVLENRAEVEGKI